VPAPESPTTRESLLNDSSRGEFADSLPDTSPYFEAWLESLESPAKLIDGAAPDSAIRFEGTLSINCNVTGVVRSQTGMLIVSETAELQANIFVATAIIHGLVRGDIRATERVGLGSKARVIGNIETPAIEIQPGARFEGRCHPLSPPRQTDDEEIARSSVDNPTSSKWSSRKTRSKPDKQEAEAMALAAGR
jgi:cytoskeletal protein CcmA (bactofilin family)